MTTKLVMLFQQGTAVSSPSQPVHRIGGWSESWYFNGTPSQALVAAKGDPTQASPPLQWGLFSTRAALLPFGATLVGCRIGTVGPGGVPVQSLALSYPGSTVKATLPQAALLCTAKGLGVSNVRRFTLRGIPTNEIVEGEYLPDFSFIGNLSSFFGSLAAWQFRGRDLSQPTNRIVSISALGVVTFEANVTYNVLDFVRILKTRDSSGNLRGGRFQISAVGPGNNNVTLLNWGFGATTGGTGRKDAIVFLNVDIANTTFGRIVTRRVGRPFTQFRGRRSRRR